MARVLYKQSIAEVLRQRAVATGADGLALRRHGGIAGNMEIKVL